MLDPRPNRPLGATKLHYWRVQRMARANGTDLVGAAEHALMKGLVGIYNVCVNEGLPKTNAEVFGALADRVGVPRLEFLNQIKAPTRKISADKLYATGWRPEHTDPDHPLNEAA